jgi:hypothetical protein
MWKNGMAEFAFQNNLKFASEIARTFERIPSKKNKLSRFICALQRVTRADQMPDNHRQVHNESRSWRIVETKKSSQKEKMVRRKIKQERKGRKSLFWKEEGSRFKTNMFRCPKHEPTKDQTPIC